MVSAADGDTFAGGDRAVQIDRVVIGKGDCTGITGVSNGAAELTWPTIIGIGNNLRVAIEIRQGEGDRGGKAKGGRHYRIAA